MFKVLAVFLLIVGCCPEKESVLKDPASELFPIVSLGNFYHAMRHSTLEGDLKGVPAEVVAKQLNRTLPSLLEGTKITKVAQEDALKFKDHFTFQVPDVGENPGTVDRTQTWCHIQCGEYPVVGERCWSVCVTCTDEWGGGCSLTVHHN